MSKIFKSSAITIDEDNRVKIHNSNNDQYINYQNEYVEEVEERKIDEESILLILEKAEEEKKFIISEAYKEAKRIRDKGKKEIDELKIKELEQAKIDGYNQGKAKIENEMQEEKRKSLEDSALIIEEAKKEREEIISSIENDAVDVIDSITKKILNSAFEINKDLILVLVKRGLSNAMIMKKVTVKVSQDDYSFVMENKDEILQLIDSSKEIEFVKDFTLKNKDCLIETEFGNISCGLNQQLEEVTYILYNLLNSKVV